MRGEDNLVHMFITVNVAVELVRKAGYEVSSPSVGLLARAIDLNLLVMDQPHSNAYLPPYMMQGIVSLGLVQTDFFVEKSNMAASKGFL